eukprot:16815-Chlamydomonas_euryale.AAC.1
MRRQQPPSTCDASNRHQHALPATAVRMRCQQPPSAYVASDRRQHALPATAVSMRCQQPPSACVAGNHRQQLPTASQSRHRGLSTGAADRICQRRRVVPRACARLARRSGSVRERAPVAAVSPHITPGPPWLHSATAVIAAAARRRCG